MIYAFALTALPKIPTTANKAYPCTAISPRKTVPGGISGRQIESLFLEDVPLFHHTSLGISTTSRNLSDENDASPSI